MKNPTATSTDRLDQLMREMQQFRRKMEAVNRRLELLTKPERKRQGPRFTFYEKVEILDDRPEAEKVFGKRGAILGRAQARDGRWTYAVRLDDSSVCHSFYEEDLESIGEFDRRENFYSGEAVRVHVDKHGRGAIIGKGRTHGARPNAH